MEAEYALYEMLDAKGLVRLHIAPTALTGFTPTGSIRGFSRQGQGYL